MYDILIALTPSGRELLSLSLCFHEIKYETKIFFQREGGDDQSPLMCFSRVRRRLWRLVVPSSGYDGIDDACNKSEITC